MRNFETKDIHIQGSVAQSKNIFDVYFTVLY